MTKPSVALTFFLLLAILAAGAFLRLRNIDHYEPFIADEAAYHLEARYLLSLAENAYKSLRLKQLEQKTGENLWKREDEARRFREEIEGRPPWYARPGHVYLLALAMAAFGTEKVYLGGLISATFGTLSIPLVFCLAARLYNRRAGLLAAALFSLSGYQAAYCHSGLTEQDSLFFLLVAALVHVSGRDREASARKKLLFATGLALGVAFVIHYRTLAVISAFFLWEAFLESYSERGGVRARLAGLFLLSSGIVVPIVLTEIPYYALTLIIHMFFQAALPFQTYFEQLLGQFFVSIYTNILSTQKSFSLTNALTYPFLVWKLEGPLWPLLLAGSVLVCAVRRRPSDKWAVLFFLLPFALCTLLQPRARYACSFLAFGTVMMGSVLAGMGRRTFGSPGRGGRVLLVALSLAVLAMSGRHAWQAAEPRRSYVHAIDFIASQGSPKHVATYPLVSQVYAGVKNVPAEWPRSEEDLRRLYELGYRFVVMDLIKDVAGLFLQQFGAQDSPALQERLALMNRIEDSQPPDYTVENLHVTPIQNLFEVNHNFSKTLSYYRSMQEIPRIRQIRVFELKDFLERSLPAAPAGEGD